MQVQKCSSIKSCCRLTSALGKLNLNLNDDTRGCERGEISENAGYARWMWNGTVVMESDHVTQAAAFTTRDKIRSRGNNGARGMGMRKRTE
jgi:hypothetical protein